jgi:hypothetical protein
VLRRGKACRLSPHALCPLAASFLRCAPDRFLLTKPNTFPHNQVASVATLRWRSGSSRNAVRLPSGIAFSFAGIPTLRQGDALTFFLARLCARGGDSESRPESPCPRAVPARRGARKRWDVTIRLAMHRPGECRPPDAGAIVGPRSLPPVDGLVAPTGKSPKTRVPVVWWRIEIGIRQTLTGRGGCGTVTSGARGRSQRARWHAPAGRAGRPRTQTSGARYSVA